MGTAVTIAEARSLAVLEVADGVHRGVEAPVEDAVVRIGSTGRSDIVLSDEGVAEDHAALRFERASVFIEARGAEIGFGRHVIPRGQGCRAKLPVEIRLGSSLIRLKRPKQNGFRLRTPMIAAGVAVALATTLVATQADAIMAMATGDQEAAATTTTAAAATPAVALAARAPADDPVAALRAQISEAKLDGLRIERDGDRIVARGLLDDAARKRWATTQRWFDGSYGGRYVLASEVGAKSAATMPRFQVQAVWFGQNPYVVTADGQRRQPGAVLGDGWVIKTIDDGRLTVAKAGEEVSFDY